MISSVMRLCMAISLLIGSLMVASTHALAAVRIMTKAEVVQSASDVSERIADFLFIDRVISVSYGSRSDGGNSDNSNSSHNGYDGNDSTSGGGDSNWGGSDGNSPPSDGQDNWQEDLKDDLGQQIERQIESTLKDWTQ